MQRVFLLYNIFIKIILRPKTKKAHKMKYKKLYTFMTNKKFNHVGTIESVIGLNK